MKSIGDGIILAANKTGGAFVVAGKGIADAAVITGKGIADVSVISGKAIADAAVISGKGIADAAVITGKGIAFAANKTVDGIVFGWNKTADGIVFAFNKTVEAIKKFGHITKEASSKFIDDVKDVTKLIGGKLDLKNIKNEHLQKILRGIEMVTSPIKKVLNFPGVDIALYATGIGPIFSAVKAVVQTIANPSQVHKILLEADPIGKMIGNFIIKTTEHPEAWLENLAVSIPGVDQVLEFADDIKENDLVQLVKNPAAKITSLVKPSLVQRMLKRTH